MPQVDWISRGAERVIADFQKVATAKERDTIATVGASRAAQELGRIAQQIARENETSQEKWTRQIINAKRALDDAKISEEQYHREVTRVTIETARATDSLGKHGAQLRANTIDIGNYAKTINGVISTQKMADQSGSGWLATLTSVRGMWFGIAGAAAGAFALIESRNRAFAEAGERVISGAKAGAGLVQLAGGDPAKLAAMRQEAAKTRLMGEFPKEEAEAQSYRLQFELEKEGLGGYREFFAQQQTQTDAAALVHSVAAVRKQFKTTAAPPEMVSGAIVAGVAGKQSREDILAGVAKAGPAAMAFGLGLEETEALVSRIGLGTGEGGEAAGERLTLLLRSLTLKGFAGKPLAESLDKITARHMSPQKAVKFLGRGGIQTLATLEAVSDTGALRNLTRDVTQGEATDRAGGDVGLAEQQPEVATEHYVNRMAAVETDTLRNLGLAQKRIQANRDVIMATTRAHFPGLVGEGLARAFQVTSAVLPASMTDTAPREIPQENMDDLAAKLDRFNEWQEKQHSQLEAQTRLLEQGANKPAQRTGPKE